MADVNQEQQLPQDPQFMQMIQQNPELMAQIQQNPEMMKQLYQDYMGKGQMADQQMAQAEQLRNSQAPQGQAAGGQFVASSPLSQMANSGMRGIGEMQNREALAKKKALSDDRGSGLQSLVQMASANQLRKPPLNMNSLVDDASMNQSSGQYT